MSSPELELLERVLSMLSEKHWDGSLSLIVIWILYRRLRYVSAALARSRQHALQLVNETWQTAFATVLKEQPRKLRDLVDDTESESSHTP